MQEFKIKMIMSVLTFMILTDIYSWQAVKTITKSYTKKIRMIWWISHVVLATLFVSGYLFLTLETNTAFKVYVSSSIFIIYLSKFLLCIFVFFDDIRRSILLAYQFLFNKKTIPVEENKQENVPNTTSDKKTITRSEFLAKAGTITAGIPLIMLSKGVFKGGYDYQIHRVPLYLKNLPPNFNGLKIIQLSDIHTGSLLDEDAVKIGIDMVKQEKPDMIFFTGDLVNNETKEAFRYADLFRSLQAPMGIFSTLGNHDYGDYIKWDTKEAKQANLNRLIKLHEEMGWNLLQNEHVTVDKGGQRISIIGVENWGNKGRFQKFGDVDKALYHKPDTAVNLLLSHDPSHFDDIISKKHHQHIDITFSGHTHGMQFGIEIGNFKWSPAQFIYPHWAGLYEVNKTRLYVNRGFGFLGYPGRVGILPEITVFELKPFKA